MSFQLSDKTTVWHFIKNLDKIQINNIDVFPTSAEHVIFHAAKYLNSQQKNQYSTATIVACKSVFASWCNMLIAGH